MKPKSNNLFHFTKSFEILKLILEHGIKPRYCLEDFEWFGLDHKYIAYPMSCFCDIPLSRISEHTGFYGSYGIGLSKNWGLQNNLNPIIYCPPNSHMQNFAKHIINEVRLPKHLKETKKVFNDYTFKLLSLIKPIQGNMVVSGEIIEKDFYQENEWRFVPEVEDFYFEQEYEEKKELLNQALETHKLEFSPEDIQYIFVPNDNDIPSLVDFINEKMGSHSLNSLKILQSRIVSLEKLSLDM
jgi:hypothetical protein